MGERLAEVVPRALAHLRLPDRSPSAGELTIELWDEAATGVGCPGCAPGADLEAPGSTATSPDGRYVTITRPQTRTCFDRAASRITGWVGDARRLTQYEIGRPLHSELLLWHRDRGLQAVHAGLVGKDGEGILLGGPGGAGKSTTALRCLLAGLEYLADDYVALADTGDDGLIGHSVYCSTHVVPADFALFPGLEPFAIPGRLAREDKSLVLLSDVPGVALGRSARIRALACPRVGPQRETTFRPASRAQALIRMAPSSLMLLPYPDALAPGFDNLSTLVHRVPVYWLELGSDLEAIPGAVLALLDEVTR